MLLSIGIGTACGGYCLIVLSIQVNLVLENRNCIGLWSAIFNSSTSFRSTYHIIPAQIGMISLC